MKRSTKIVTGSVTLLLLAGGVGFFFSQTRVASLVKAVAGVEAAAEELLTDAVGTNVTIDSIETSFSDGEMTILGLAVRNPEGFRTETALAADEIRVVLEVATLLEETVVIREISVERPIVTYEVGRDGSNLDAIQRNVESYAGPGSGPGQDRPTTRILIENLYVRNGTVAASAVFLDGRSVEVPLPDIHLRNLSTGRGGTTAGDIVEEITAEIVRNARESVVPLGEITEEVKERLAGAASRVVEDVKRKIETGSGSARDTLEKGVEAAEEELDRKVESAREALDKGARSAKEALGKSADSTRKALESGTDSAREALGKGTDKVKEKLKKLLGKGNQGE